MPLEPPADSVPLSVPLSGKSMRAVLSSVHETSILQEEATVLVVLHELFHLIGWTQ